MKAVVFAYHNMGIAGLDALERAGLEISLIFSHADDPAENCWFGSVREWGIKRGIPVECPMDIREEKWTKRIAALAPEMIFSFYYRFMLPDEILVIPTWGAYNLHGSLLPKYRGRAPVNWVLVNGEKQTGVTLHHLGHKPDAGDIVGQRVVPIAFEDTALALFGKLCAAAGGLLDELLPLMKIGKAPRIKQDLAKGSYFGGRRPDDGRICWSWPAERIYNLIRAVTDPYPGAFGAMPDCSRLMVWWGLPQEDEETGEKSEQEIPGTIGVENKMVTVQTGEGKIRLLDVQSEGVRMTGDALYNFFKKREGIKLS
ncbi:MAG: formyltransferase [Syntrophales bacterium]|jgi:UDP-4-amino-4-deoxy-L-arabinose formyltransferase/UDP-glucuronic acid dehydrogenase (UDP-4-keto-hexauronic acid decarboxylating)|nr:formyltransferase [Syntrophales bacterium]